MGDVRQTEIYTAETFVPEHSAAEVEVAIRKLKRYRSPRVDQILAGGETLHCKLIKLIYKKELPHQWSQLVYLFTKMVVKQTIVIFEAYHCC
jgi:hypothetical protein